MSSPNWTAEHIEEELKALRNQTAALANLARYVLAAHTDVTALMGKTVALVAQTLGVEYCEILELLPDGEHLVLQAGVGWDDDLVGSMMVAAEANVLVDRAFSAAEPVVIGDLCADMRFSMVSWPDGPEITSSLGVVIPGRERVFGILAAHTTQKRAFTDDDIRFLQAVAGMLARSLECRQVEADEQSDHTLAEALRDTAAVLTGSLDLNVVLDQILNNLRYVAPHDAATIMLIESGMARSIRSRSYTGWASDEEAPPSHYPLADTFPLRQMAETRQPIVIPDTQRCADWADVPSTHWIRSCVGAPICLGGEPIGFLCLDSASPGAFTPVHAESLRAFADQAAIAIRNAQLYEQVRRYAAQLEALHRVTLDITAQLDLTSLLFALVESAVELLGAKEGNLYLYRPERDVLEWVVGIGPGPTLAGTELKHGEGLGGKVWETGEPLIVDNYSEWEGRARILDDYHFTAIIGVPIRWGDEFLGVVNVLANAPQHIFSGEDARLFALLAAQAAIAIHNARMYGESEDRNRRLALLNQITRVGTATLDLDELLQKLADIASQIVGGDDCYITLWDAEHCVPIGVAAYGEQRDTYADKTAEPGEATLTGSALKAGHPLIIEDIFNSLYVSHRIAERAATSRSLLVLPLQADGRDLGALLVSFREIHHFTDEETAWAGQAAELVALAIAKARAYAELEQRVEERTAELRAANRQLMTLAAMKDDFIANVSHELRTPISNLKLYHHLLVARPDKQDTYMATLRRETDRLERIIEDLLYLSRMDGGRVTLNPAPVDLSALASQYVEDRALLAESYGLALAFSGEPCLPTVEADVGLLGQALGILMTNAFNYTLAGGRVTVGAHIRQADGKQWVGVSVGDTGLGVLPSEVPHLFARFFRGTAAHETGAPGTGLGLAIVKEIVHRHGGQVEVQSEGIPGKGATFTIWLPVEKSEGEVN